MKKDKVMRSMFQKVVFLELNPKSKVLVVYFRRQKLILSNKDNHNCLQMFSILKIIVILCLWTERVNMMSTICMIIRRDKITTSLMYCQFLQKV